MLTHKRRNVKEIFTVIAVGYHCGAGNDARFGPIGVAEALRGAGLGGVLIDLQMMEMKKRGIYSFYFLWTHGDAIRFYERHGLNIYRTYQLYRKKI